ncbi:MAG: cation transporter [Candidatus Moduliflexus flocculans]|nr:cation transporter [Candidatus Moduliflexus flocculans]
MALAIPASFMLLEVARLPEREPGPPGRRRAHAHGCRGLGPRVSSLSGSRPVPGRPARTFGWRRFEIFAAILNGIALWAVAGLIGYEAFARLKAPPEVKSGMMIAVAALGLLSNDGIRDPACHIPVGNGRRSGLRNGRLPGDRKLLTPALRRRRPYEMRRAQSAPAPIPEARGGLSRR